MAEVHKRMKALRGEPDPLKAVAAEIAKETRVLCFDEFHVSDIADAMILGRLLENLFEDGVVLVATSNYAPAELYPQGQNRSSFLSTIASLEQPLTVHQYLLSTPGLVVSQICGGAGCIVAILL